MREKAGERGGGERKKGTMTERKEGGCGGRGGVSALAFMRLCVSKLVCECVFLCVCVCACMCV